MLGAVVLSLARLAKPHTNIRRLWQLYNYFSYNFSYNFSYGYFVFCYVTIISIVFPIIFYYVSDSHPNSEKLADANSQPMR
jgi:hypothetical protein